MKMIYSALVMSLALLAGSAYAADAAPGVTPQQKDAMSPQDRMKECNKEATGKTGDDRKGFMKGCLTVKKGDKPDAPAKVEEKSMAAPAKMSQTDKMKACNKDATGKTGDDRKAFMKSCLSAN